MQEEQPALVFTKVAGPDHGFPKGRVKANRSIKVKLRALEDRVKVAVDPKCGVLRATFFVLSR